MVEVTAYHCIGALCLTFTFERLVPWCANIGTSRFSKHDEYLS